MATAIGDCHVCGAEGIEIHLLATCERCRAAAGRFSLQAGQTGRRPRKIPERASYQDSFRCSFCARAPHEVRKIFSGPWVLICDGCVALAVDAMREDLGEAWGAGFEPPRETPPAAVDRKTLPGHAVLDPRDITQVGRAALTTGRKAPRKR